MKPKNLWKIGFLLLPVVGRAVYAPIPEQEQGRALVVTVQASAYYDSNIFGAAGNVIDSMVYSLAPRIAFNASADSQTFFSASYQPRLDYFENRPTQKSLLSHEVAVRLARAFSDATSIDLNDSFNIEKNPESALNGVPLNTDQSYTENEFEGRLKTGLGPKTGLVFKYRNTYYDYNDHKLGQELDRMEHLLGLEANYKLVPEASLVGEYRYQIINYRDQSSTKDKRSNFLLTGLDYALGKQLTFSTRVGAEDRQRTGETSTTAPYAEVTLHYDFADQSFVSAGYTYSLQETDDPVHFTDSKVNQYFVNLQYAFSASVLGSTSLTELPSILLGTPGNADVHEKTTRLGFALTYMVNKNSTVSATYDYDLVGSGLASRDQLRSRVGVNCRLYF